MGKMYRLRQWLWVSWLGAAGLSGPLYARNPEKIDQLRNQAEALYSRGDYQQALSVYRQGYRLAYGTDPVRAANLAVDISSVYHMQGDFRKGASVCLEGLQLLKKSPVALDSVRFKLCSSLGEMYKKLNLKDSCYLYFSEANATLRRNPVLEAQIPDYVIYHYNNQGMMYVRSGSYSEGLGYLTKALSMAEKYRPHSEDIGILRNNLGQVYEGLGVFDKGLALRKSAVSLYPKQDNTKGLMFCGIAIDAIRVKAFPEALRYASLALSLARTLQKSAHNPADVELEALALYRIGQCYRQLHRPGPAEKALREAIRRYRASGAPGGYLISLACNELALLKQEQGQTAQALDLYQQSLQGVETRLQPRNSKPASGLDLSLIETGLFEALTGKAHLLFGLYRTDKKEDHIRRACQTYQQALRVADAMRRSYNALPTKWFFTNKVHPAYQDAFEAAFALATHTRQPSDYETAFALMEQGKSAALSDVTRELLIKPGNVPDSLLTRERELQRTITASKLDRVGESSGRLAEAQVQLAQLQQTLEREFVAYFKAKYDNRPITVRQLMSALPDRTAYLSYRLTPEAVYVAVVSHKGLTMIRMDVSLPELYAAVQALTQTLVTNPGFGSYRGSTAAIRCFQGLIEPIENELKDINRLLVCPDGLLHRIPFEVLETGRVVDDYLTKRYAIGYVASASALLDRRKSAPADNSPSLLSVAPFIKPVNPPPTALPLRYLPASRLEVERLPGEALLEKSATKNRFLQRHDRYDVLHFATHAYADDVEPARSYIAFYPDGTPYRLYSEEIYNLSLEHTRLVVLSACQTGGGKLHPGEGVLSLARAFSYAGCPSIVSTLWNANDESAAYLSERLYVYLQEGQPLDVALQHARLDYFRSDLYAKLSHPHYWANLVLIGDSGPVYRKPWPARPALAVLLIGSFLTGILFVLRQRSVKTRAGATEASL